MFGDEAEIGKWRYTPTIMDGPVVRYAWNDRFEINASRNGVSFCGPAPVMGSVDEIKKLLDIAYSAHKLFAYHRGDGGHNAAKAWVKTQNDMVEVAPTPLDGGR